MRIYGEYIHEIQERRRLRNKLKKIRITENQEKEKNQFFNLLKLTN